MRRRIVKTGVMAGTGFAFVAAAWALDKGAAAPSIEGTYRLISRRLPDGKLIKYPDVFGLITFTKEYRNFNVYWKEEGGKAYSISYGANYTLTDKEYSEKSLFYVERDERGGKKVRHDLSGPSGKSPVTLKDQRIEFTLPLYGEPSLVFEGDDMLVATRKGEFEDTWVRVK